MNRKFICENCGTYVDGTYVDRAMIFCDSNCAIEEAKRKMLQHELFIDVVNVLSKDKYSHNQVNLSDLDIARVFIKITPHFLKLKKEYKLL